MCALKNWVKLMIVKGNSAAKIPDIENVEIVFKDGVGYDLEKLIQSVHAWLGSGKAFPEERLSFSPGFSPVIRLAQSR